MAKSRSRRVIFQPAAHKHFQKGIHQMVEAIRPTLGPLPGIVALETIPRDRKPEVLDDGGVIARRIIQIADRDADMGAMFLRQMLWRLHKKVGDGTATAAVLFQTVYDESLRYLTAGGNAMILRKHLESGMQIILDELARMSTPVEGKERIAQIAESICYDPPLAKMFGEIFDIVGEYGRIEIRAGRGRDLEREYVEGIYWDQSGALARHMLFDAGQLRTDMEDVAILISNLDVEDPRHMAKFLITAAGAGVKSLLIVANRLSESTLGLFPSANRNPEKFRAIAVRAPGTLMNDQIATLEDLAALTGGRPYNKTAGQSLAAAKIEDLGHARRAWADRYNFGIIGGKGDPRALREHIARLRALHVQLDDPTERKKLQQRIGKLMGGSATLYIGGLTEMEIERRKATAERTADALRGALGVGVAPGGGVAYLDCRAALRDKLAQTPADQTDERAAYRILLHALEAPARAIIHNAGYNPDEMLAEIRLAGPGHGFDVRAGQVVNMAQAGIFDATHTLQSALYSAVSSAALALTVDVLVHHKKPQQSTEP